MDLYVVGNKSSSMNDIGLCASGARMDRNLQEWVFFVVAVNRDTRHLLVMTLINIFECYKLSALYSINIINRAGVLTSVINFYKHIYRIRLVKSVKNYHKDYGSIHNIKSCRVLHGKTSKRTRNFE